LEFIVIIIIILLVLLFDKRNKLFTEKTKRKTKMNKEKGKGELYTIGELCTDTISASTSREKWEIINVLIIINCYRNNSKRR